MNISHEHISAIKDALVELNAEIEEKNIEVKAFFTEYDEELEGLAVSVIFVAEEIANDLETLDHYCEAANQKLGEKVVFVNCIYRTNEEFNEDFGNGDWENIIRKVVS